MPGETSVGVVGGGQLGRMFALEDAYVAGRIVKALLPDKRRKDVELNDAAIAALEVFDAEVLLRVAEISLAMTLEALMGCSDAFDERIHKARGHKGQIRVAKMVQVLTRGSSLIDAAGRIQDAYSLRCAPQVQGIGWDTIEFVKG